MSYRDSRAYMTAALFVVGNIVLPQLCHLVPQGGLVWLPIYFFTLVAAYKFGLTAGLLTAIASPVVNSLLFGMPAAASLPIILIKSVLLALAAAFIASRVRGGLPRDRNDGRMGHDRLAHCSPSGHPSGLAWHAGADIRRLRHYKVNQEIMAF